MGEDAGPSPGGRKALVVLPGIASTGADIRRGRCARHSAVHRAAARGAALGREAAVQLHRAWAGKGGSGGQGIA